MEWEKVEEQTYAAEIPIPINQLDTLHIILSSTIHLFDSPQLIYKNKRWSDYILESRTQMAGISSANGAFQRSDRKQNYIIASLDHYLSLYFL